MKHANSNKINFEKEKQIARKFMREIDKYIKIDRTKFYTDFRFLYLIIDF